MQLISIVRRICVMSFLVIGATACKSRRSQDAAIASATGESQNAICYDLVGFEVDDPAAAWERAKVELVPLNQYSEDNSYLNAHLSYPPDFDEPASPLYKIMARQEGA